MPETKDEKWEDLSVEQVKWDNPKTVQGRLMEIQETSLGSPFCIFTQDDGKRIGFLATTQLANYITKKNIGRVFRIEYQGEMPTSDGENTFKSFKVLIKKP